MKTSPSRVLVLSVALLAATVAGAEGLKISDSGDVRAVIDALLMMKAPPEVVVTTAGGAFQGAVLTRTQQFLVLKEDQHSKYLDGPSRGESIFMYHYVSLGSIIAVSFRSAP
jgi:hypothetical protein